MESGGGVTRATTGGRPLYLKVAESLRRDIVDERMHGPLPSEAQLQQQFGVSRSVVRQALRALTAEGLIMTVRGKGSFTVPPARVHRVVQSLNGLSMQLEQLGGSTRTEVLDFDVVAFRDAPTEWQSSEALRIRRLRYGFGYPLALIETLLPPGLADTIQRDDLESGSLHSLLRVQAGIELEKSRRTISAVPASLEVATALRAVVGAPVLLLQGTTMDKQGKTVEVFSTYHRGDRVEFDVETVI